MYVWTLNIKQGRFRSFFKTSLLQVFGNDIKIRCRNTVFNVYFRKLSRNSCKFSRTAKILSIIYIKVSHDLN